MSLMPNIRAGIDNESKHAPLDPVQEWRGEGGALLKFIATIYCTDNLLILVLGFSLDMVTANLTWKERLKKYLSTGFGAMIEME